MRKLNIDDRVVISDYLDSNMSLIKLSIKYLCDKRYIKKILLRNGVYKEPFIKIEDVNIKSILEDYNNNIPIYKISKNNSISHRRVVNILKDNKIFNRGNIKYKFNRKIFSVVDDEKRAYWLGFLYADGCVFKSKNNITNHVSIKLSSKDKKHLELFKRDFELPHEITVKSVRSFNKVFEYAQIRISSKEMVNDLIKLGCFPNKTFTLQFPDIEKELVHHFMRGYFDGDGSIYNGKQKNWYILGNYDFLKEYQKKLIEEADLNKIKIHKKKNIYSLSYGGNLNINKIYNFLYNNSEIYMERKKINFLN